MGAPHPHHPHPDHRRMHEEVWTRERAEAVLDAPDRPLTQDPHALWRRAGLKEGETVLDVGAGTGFYAFPAAEIVGPTGRVLAVDVSSELVDLVRERARDRGLAQVRALRSTPDRIPVDSAVADIALFANILHGVPPATIDETRRILREEGRLVNVDWRKEPTPGGPPVEVRLTAEESEAILARHGFVRVDAWLAGPYHHALLFRRGP